MVFNVSGLTILKGMSVIHYYKTFYFPFYSVKFWALHLQVPLAGIYPFLTITNFWFYYYCEIFGNSFMLNPYFIRFQCIHFNLYHPSFESIFPNLGVSLLYLSLELFHYLYVRACSACRSQRGQWISWSGVIDSWVSWRRCWKPNSSPLELFSPLSSLTHPLLHGRTLLHSLPPNIPHYQGLNTDHASPGFLKLSLYSIGWPRTHNLTKCWNYRNGTPCLMSLTF